MKVLWFANNPCEGIEYLTNNNVSTGGWLYSLCRQLRKMNGVELHIAFFWGHELDAFEYKGVAYHPILREGGDSKIGRYVNRIMEQMVNVNDQRFKKRCLKIISELQPDIIHVHGSEEAFGLISQDKELRVPIVLSIQGLLSVYRLKYYSGMTARDISRSESIGRKILRSDFNSIYENISKRSSREIAIFKHLQYVIGRTDWDRRCAYALNPQAKYFTVNELLRSEFMTAIWEKPNILNQFELITTISSGIYKGLEVIYQTAQLLSNLSFPFAWKIVGVSADDEMVRVVERRFCVCAKDIHIDLLGRMPATEMLHYMLRSEMYIQVSHIENSSNSLCEAMILGMPIIASFAGGTSSMVQDGVEGVLLQDGNSYELAGAIMEAKNNYSQAVLMGQNARKRAMLRHNPEKVVSELMAVYDYLYARKER